MALLWIWVSPRCGSLYGKIGTPHQKTSAPASFRPHPFPGYFISGMLTWRIRATPWYSLISAKIWWCEGGGYDYLGSITWSYAQQLRFGGDSPPCSSISVSHTFGMPPWNGALRTFHCPPYRQRPWSCAWLPRSHRPPFPKGFLRLRFPSWCMCISSWSNDPWIWWLPIIMCGLDPQWLVEWSMVGKIPSGQLNSWPRVWSMRVSWLICLGVWLCYSMESCVPLQIFRRHKGGGF